MKDPVVSIIVVNFNGRKYIDKCIASIIDANYEPYEIILVDNSSDDDSLEFVKNKYSHLGEKLSIIALDKNYGPALARNRGSEIARGRYLCFLDNDTEVHPEWAEYAVRAFEENPKTGIIQCKLLLSKERDKIDYVGEFIGQNGFLVQRGLIKDVDQGQYDQSEQILAAKSAGMFIVAAVFKKIGGFDEDYFIYVEETDLGWRAWLSGYQALFIAKSIVYHEFGTSTIILSKGKNDYNAKFHGCKNYILTLIKNLGFLSLVKVLPIHIFLWMGLAWFALLSRREIMVFWWIHKAILWNLYYLPLNLQKRLIIQKSRVINDKDLFSIVMKKKPLKYFLNKVLKPASVGNAKSFFGENNEG